MQQCLTSRRYRKRAASSALQEAAAQLACAGQRRVWSARQHQPQAQDLIFSATIEFFNFISADSSINDTRDGWPRVGVWIGIRRTGLVEWQHARHDAARSARIDTGRRTPARGRGAGNPRRRTSSTPPPSSSSTHRATPGAGPHLRHHQVLQLHWQPHGAAPFYATSWRGGFRTSSVRMRARHLFARPSPTTRPVFRR